jgi:hypothetical protein
MHINGDKIHQQAVRYVLMIDALAIDFRAARAKFVAGGCITTNFVEQDNCCCYFGSGIEADAACPMSALYYMIM